MNAQAETQSISVTYDLPQSPPKVWRALTESSLLASWLMPNDIRPVLGHVFTFTAQPMPGWDGIVHCKVLEVEPEKRLRYSWCGGPASSRLETVVAWTLVSTASGGTLLALEHSGFLPSNEFALDGMGRGWQGRIADRLRDALSRST